MKPDTPDHSPIEIGRWNDPSRPDPACSICGRVMYRHPIVIWALRCLRCDTV